MAGTQLQASWTGTDIAMGILLSAHPLLHYFSISNKHLLLHKSSLLISVKSLLPNCFSEENSTFVTEDNTLKHDPRKWGIRGCFNCLKAIEGLVSLLVDWHYIVSFEFSHTTIVLESNQISIRSR